MGDNALKREQQLHCLHHLICMSFTVLHVVDCIISPLPSEQSVHDMSVWVTVFILLFYSRWFTTCLMRAVFWSPLSKVSMHTHTPSSSGKPPLQSRIIRCIFGGFNLPFFFFSPPRPHRWAGRRTPSDPEVVGRTDGITTTPPSAFGAEASLRPSQPASSLSSYFLLHSPETKGKRREEEEEVGVMESRETAFIAM